MLIFSKILTHRAYFHSFCYTNNIKIMLCPGGSCCLLFISSALSGDSCFSMVHAGIDKSGFTLKKWVSLTQNMFCTLLSLSLKSCFCKNCIFLIHTWLMHFVYCNMCTCLKLIYLEILGKLIPPLYLYVAYFCLQPMCPTSVIFTPTCFNHLTQMPIQVLRFPMKLQSDPSCKSDFLFLFPTKSLQLPV